MMRARIMKLAATSGVGPMIRVTILHLTLANDMKPSQFTYCMRNGVSKYGSELDQTRPLQPTHSRMPHTTTLGRSHHIRK